MREEADERTDERDYKRRREKDTQRRAAAFSVCGAFFFCRLPSAFVLEPPSLLRPKGIFGVCFNRSRLAESTILLLLFKPHWGKKKKKKLSDKIRMAIDIWMFRSLRYSRNQITLRQPVMAKGASRSSGCYISMNKYKSLIHHICVLDHHKIHPLFSTASVAQQLKGFIY